MNYKELAEEEKRKFNEAHRAISLTVTYDDASSLPFGWMLSGKPMGWTGIAAVLRMEGDLENIFTIFLDNGEIYDTVSCHYDDSSWVELRKREQ